MHDNDQIKEHLKNAVYSLYMMIVTINDANGECHIIDQNPEIKNIGGDAEKVYFGRFIRELHINIHPEDRYRFDIFMNPKRFHDELAENVYTSIECRLRQADNRYYWVEITVCNATAEDNPGGHDHILLIRDIHMRKMAQLRDEAEERAVFRTLQDKYDSLFEENMTDQQTGCYNRKGLKYYSDYVLADARDNGKNIFVCVADLNGLKYLNDTYGHQAGDEAIAAISDILLKAAPTGTKIVRTGGDEFLLFAALEAGSKEPEFMNAKIEEGVEIYNKEHPHPYKVGVSYGWILLPVKEGMVNLDEYIEIADEKMYSMKVERDEHRREQ